MRRFSRETASVAIDYSLAPSLGFQLCEVRVHLSDVGGAQEDLTIWLDSMAGAAYDIVFLAQDMNAVKDLVYQPTRPHEFVVGDVLRVQYTNTNLETYGLEVVWSLAP